MNMNELKEFAEIYLKAALDELKDEKEYGPIIVSINENEFKVTFIPWENDEDKKNMPVFFLDKARECEAIIIIMETYILDMGENNDERPANIIDHPNTISALIGIVFTQGAKSMRIIYSKEKDYIETNDRGWNDQLPDCPGFENPYDNIPKHFL